MGQQRKNLVGQGYMPKGGVKAAQASNERVRAEQAARAHPAGPASPSPGRDLSPAPSVVGPADARQRGRRAVTVEALAVVGAVSGCAALVGELVHVIVSAVG